VSDDDEKDRLDGQPSFSGTETRVASASEVLLERARRRLSRAVLNLLDVFTLINAIEGAPPFVAHFDVLGDLIHAWCELVSGA
jgi:hypothetical protein